MRVNFVGQFQLVDLSGLCQAVRGLYREDGEDGEDILEEMTLNRDIGYFTFALRMDSHLAIPLINVMIPHVENFTGMLNDREFYIQHERLQQV